MVYTNRAIPMIIYTNQLNQKGDNMRNYDFEYCYRPYNQKQRKYKIPIEIKLNNEQYKQEQLKFIRELFPNGINKQNKIGKDFLLEIFSNDLNKIIEVY
ncbi:MAG: hypothetical protein ACFFDF_24735 [Candidatus Odinarchaeota archaeon]